MKGSCDVSVFAVEVNMRKEHYSLGRQLNTVVKCLYRVSFRTLLDLSFSLTAIKM